MAGRKVLTWDVKQGLTLKNRSLYLAKLLLATYYFLENEELDGGYEMKY